MYNRIILPTDGSKCAMEGVKEGLEFGEELGIKVIAVYVVNTSEFESLHHESIRASAKSGLKEKGKKALGDVKEAAEGRDIELETKLLAGKPYRKITQLADENDIIYISTHGLSGFSNLFLGSTTERVLKNTEATVAVVNGR
ncbi:MAG: universal stress protein [Candidatus Thermoplasmatota archaeon]|nr:universal stress protein [Candidatus Thermoplasmatota archaeon]